MRGTHVRGVVDPLFDVGNLRISLLALGQGKLVTNRGTADRNAAKKRVALEGNQSSSVDFLIKIIARQLSPFQLVIGAIINKVMHVYDFGAFGPSLRMGCRIKIVAKTIRGQA